tara:strand:+ start:381 stop:1232 length:852 start_codon:yes stop_codon:yes gene_type:complete
VSVFSYLSQKIHDAEYSYTPFKHLLIEDFLSEEHLENILSDPQVHFDKTADTRQLIQVLLEKGYAVQNFPGCTDNISEYLHHYENDSFPHGRKGTPIESYGITYRLRRYDTKFTQELVEYLNGDEFKQALEEKFDITEDTRILTAIQKNLSHYEISPHPDIREKSLTYLININKDSSVDNEDIHTHLLQFKPEWKGILDFWKEDRTTNTTWVPWDWCETKVVTNKNNSLVMFRPSVDTLHAVRMKYDHTQFQRTQLYGNLMSLKQIMPSGNYKELQKLRKNDE